MDHRDAISLTRADADVDSPATPPDATRPHWHSPRPSTGSAGRLARPRGAPRASLAAIPQRLQLLRIRDVCRLLRISQPTLWRLRHDHRFPEPTEVTGRIVAWRQSDIEAWIAAHRRPVERREEW